MNSPLTNILLKIFANGFYKTHAGILFFLFLVMFGMVEPSQLLSYHEALMIAFITSPILMLVVFLVWMLYTLKSWHYVAGQLFGIHQQFLFYSSTSYPKLKQFYSWVIVQVTVSLPILIYAIISIGVAIKHHYYLPATTILCYVVILIGGSALLYSRLVNKLIDGSKQSILFKFTKNWHKPYFSLYIYHMFNKLKVRYLITKILSYLIISGVFLMFADVSHDFRVAGIAMLAIAVSHSVIVFDERQFEDTFLNFARNLPISRLKLFISFLSVYFFLLLPETVWLFVRFKPVMAVGLLSFSLSVILLFHNMLYNMGLDMEKYMTRVMVLFIVLFWVVMFKLLWLLIFIDLSVAYYLFYNNYYKPQHLINE